MSARMGPLTWMHWSLGRSPESVLDAPFLRARNQSKDACDAVFFLRTDPVTQAIFARTNTGGFR
jgi:hypothetical protein